ncbi:MAG: hypothetical protein PHC61_14500 [Chitinivibrionales bacterium]|nr:hypothetical protein [Chitinivibrionales bacterium]
MLRKKLLAAIITVGISISSVYAIMGAGAHWGMDFSLSMPDQPRQHVDFDSLRIKITPLMGTRPAGFDSASFPYISGKSIPIFVSRTDFKRDLGNIGGKLFIDGLPFIVLDAMEISGNFGVWEYKGKLIYPDSTLSFNTGTSHPANPDSLFKTATYDTFDVAMSKFKGLSLLGVGNTPYANLHVDFTLRKTVYRFPFWEKALRVYVGAGANMAMATPLLSTAIIQSALGDSLGRTKLQDVSALNTMLSDPVVMRKIAEKIMGTFSKPAWGMQLAAGTILKFPNNLLGIYIDGKLLIPLTKVEDDLRNVGFMVNFGILAGF